LCERFGSCSVPFQSDFSFARMSNLGARAGSGELILFLNDDTSPLDETWMSRLASQAMRVDVGAAGALLTYPDGRIQHAGVQIGTSNGAGHPGRLSNGIPIFPWLMHTREQLAVTGACMMMRRRVFEELNGFDECFPVNYNDVDLCLRAGKAGYKVMLESDARVQHQESTTRKIGISYGERRRFMDRWAGRIAAGDPYLNPNLTDNELLRPDPTAFERVERFL
jgi:GT2 family glycosyltransferase